MTQAEFEKRYEYGESDKIGSGGFGDVYRAYDVQTERFVAIKCSPLKSDWKHFTLEREVNIARKRQHPNIALYYDCYQIVLGKGIQFEYAVLKHYKDGNLEKFLQRNQLSEHETKQFIRGILTGVQFLHQNGITHRDLKAPNILIEYQDGVWIPKITDFGQSQEGVFDWAKTNSAIGISYDYAAPEQIEGHAKIFSNVDLWAVGVLIYRIVAGELPFRVKSPQNTQSQSELIRKIVYVELPERLNTLPEPYKSMILKCLVKDMSARAQHAEELLQMMDEYYNPGLAKRKAEEERIEKLRQQQEAAAKLKVEQEAAAKLKAEQEAAAKLKAEQEVATKLKAEQEVATKLKAEQEAVAKLKAEQEAVTILKVEQEVAAKLKAEHAAAAKLKAEKEAAVKLKAEQAAAAKLKAEQEAVTILKAEKQAAEKLKAEQEAAAKLKSEKETAAKLKSEKETAEKLKAEQNAAKNLKTEQNAVENLKAEQNAGTKLKAQQETDIKLTKRAMLLKTWNNYSDDSKRQVKLWGGATAMVCLFGVIIGYFNGQRDRKAENDKPPVIVITTMPTIDSTDITNIKILDTTTKKTDVVSSTTTVAAPITAANGTSVKIPVKRDKSPSVANPSGQALSGSSSEPSYGTHGPTITGNPASDSTIKKEDKKEVDIPKRVFASKIDNMKDFEESEMTQKLKKLGPNKKFGIDKIKFWSVVFTVESDGRLDKKYENFLCEKCSEAEKNNALYQINAIPDFSPLPKPFQKGKEVAFKLKIVMSNGKLAPLSVLEQ